MLTFAHSALRLVNLSKPQFSSSGKWGSWIDNFPDLFWLENSPLQLRSLVAGFKDVGWNSCFKKGA